MVDGVLLCGCWVFRCLESPGGPVLWESEIQNRVTNQGLAYLANVAFHLGSQVYAGPFYAGLINSTPAPTLAYTTDTFASGGHPGWVEFTGYTGTNRPLWTPGAAATITSPIVANSEVMSVTIGTAGKIYGGLIVNVPLLANLSSPTAILFAEGPFSDGQKDVGVGNVIQFNYGLTMRSSM